ncbi:MAG: hypothetical protein JW760_04210 [Spirochaetales bacterium]|nr:hypothetical protein [Spirochaetales bacterium]
MRVRRCMIIFEKIIPVIIIILFFGSCSTGRNLKSSAEGKFHPGHYIGVGPGPTEELAEIKYLDEPAVRGVNKRYFWRMLEPEKGVYDFSLLEADLEYLESRGKQLVVFLMDKSFSSRKVLPDYLSEYAVASEGNGYSPIRWDPFFIDRLLSLGKALSERFDSHPNFEGLAVQESSLDISSEDSERLGYTPEAYRDGLITLLTGLQRALPESHVFWYSNFLPGNNDYLYDVADTIADYGVFMGGPDILPYHRYLSRVSYPMYRTYRKRLTLFCCAQGDSYRHHKNDVRLDEEELVHDEGYLTMEEIFLFARDSLHVRYIFWDYEYEGLDKGYRTFNDAIEVIRNHPVFNESEVWYID